MQTSSLTIKGQVTIPAKIRKQLGLNPGDKIGFTIENDHVVLYRKETNIETAFGICHPKISVDLKTMDEAIRKRGGHAGS